MNLETVGIFLLVCVPFFLMTVWSVVNAAEKEFATLGTKVLWVMVASIPFVGFIIYWLFGARKGRKPGAGGEENV
jgi:hypothetical protein